MQQVVETARGLANPPPELRLHWQLRKYNALPSSGGLLDQDFVLLHRMDVYGNIYHAVDKLFSSVGDEIHKLTDGERRIIRELRELGMI